MSLEQRVWRHKQAMLTQLCGMIKEMSRACPCSAETEQAWNKFREAVELTDRALGPYPVEDGVDTPTEAGTPEQEPVDLVCPEQEEIHMLAKLHSDGVIEIMDEE